MSDESIINVSSREDSNNWSPIEGTHFSNLINSLSLSDDERDNLRRETFSIMTNCVSPSGVTDRNTGLVIGYVQSGKTLSFTALSAMACDNEYQIILLLAGTTNNLLDQSYRRIIKDLDVENNRSWKVFSTDSRQYGETELRQTETELEKWQRTGSRNRARTVLIITMKQHQHLENLARLFSSLNLRNVPTLIIDDEGDQAGMNTRAQHDEESTTYARITSLREQFPHHTYLLYTATPQAPLLISRMDVLSPEFGEVLTPGNNYVGGQTFFDGNEEYIRLIPSTDVLDIEDPLDYPPESLKEALRFFYLGVAVGLHKGEYQHSNRSMMIHPAIGQNSHLVYFRWVNNLTQDWKDILDDTQRHEYLGLIEEFRNTFADLQSTYTETLNFDEILSLLYYAIAETQIQEVNTRGRQRIPNINWKNEYSWILVGGIGLDRGFTVEGLTVSYMPRNVGIGNVDTLEQRARFFGYKRSYLGLCRIFLTGPNINAFTNYVEHEETVRDSIKSHLQSGHSLTDWRRQWLLGERLNPTRNSVVMLDMYQSRTFGWQTPRRPHINNSASLDENRNIVSRIQNNFTFQEYREPGWTDIQAIPRYNNAVPIIHLFEDLSLLKSADITESTDHTATLFLLGRLLQNNPDATCRMYCFNRSNRSERQSNGEIEIFQGRNVATNYPGARNLRDDDRVTIHIHAITVTTRQNETILDVPVIAIHIPNELGSRLWVESDEDAVR